MKALRGIRERLRPASPARTAGAEPLALTVPLPPSDNDHWRPVVRYMRGQPVAALILTDEARAYKRTLAMLLARVRPLEGPVRMRIRAHFANGRSDLANRIKALNDSLQGIAFENDRQVKALEICEGERAEPAYLDVEVLPLAMHSEP